MWPVWSLCSLSLPLSLCFRLASNLDETRSGESEETRRMRRPNKPTIHSIKECKLVYRHELGNFSLQNRVIFCSRYASKYTRVLGLVLFCCFSPLASWTYVTFDKVRSNCFPLSLFFFFLPAITAIISLLLCNLNRCRLNFKLSMQLDDSSARKCWRRCVARYKRCYLSRREQTCFHFSLHSMRLYDSSAGSVDVSMSRCRGGQQIMEQAKHEETQVKRPVTWAHRWSTFAESRVRALFLFSRFFKWYERPHTSHLMKN